MGGKLGGLLMGRARPRAAPRAALSREYERQGGEKRHGRAGRGARSVAGEKGGVRGGSGATRAAWSPAAAGGGRGGGGGAGQPGEGGKKQKQNKTKTKRKQTKKNQNEKPDGRSKYDMKIRGQMRSREVPQRREGRRWRETEREGRQCMEGLWQSPAWVGPCSRARRPCWGRGQRDQKRCQGWVGQARASAPGPS